MFIITFFEIFSTFSFKKIILIMFRGHSLFYIVPKKSKFFQYNWQLRSYDQQNKFDYKFLKLTSTYLVVVEKLQNCLHILINTWGPHRDSYEKCSRKRGVASTHSLWLKCHCFRSSSLGTIFNGLRAWSWILTIKRGD